MTTDAFLWVILVLLSVLLVIVVVTARRGPWEGRLTGRDFAKTDQGKPITGPDFPKGAYIKRVDSSTQATLAKGGLLARALARWQRGDVTLRSRYAVGIDPAGGPDEQPKIVVVERLPGSHVRILSEDEWS